VPTINDDGPPPDVNEPRICSISAAGRVVTAAVPKISSNSGRNLLIVFPSRMGEMARLTFLRDEVSNFSKPVNSNKINSGQIATPFVVEIIRYGLAYERHIAGAGSILDNPGMPEAW
jgi:hypothetical protein